MSKITLQTLENERDILIKKLEAIERVIVEYKTSEGKSIGYELDRSGRYQLVFDSISNPRKTMDGFPVKAKWLDQILHMLEDRNRFMSNYELARDLTDYHYGFNIDKMKRKVSVVISAAYKQNRIAGLIKVGTTKSSKDALWGFDWWLTDDGDIKEEHRPFGRRLEGKIKVG